MMEIQVMSRSAAINFYHDKPWAIISIKNPDMDDAWLDCPNLKHTLRLAFDDVDAIVEGMVPFTLPMAEQIWGFVEKLDVDLLVVHCNMGFSRSPAVAAALSKVWTGDDAVFFEHKSPNRRVYRAMLHTAKSRGLMNGR